jgi:lysophospholipase L1-like esterase
VIKCAIAIAGGGLLGLLHTPQQEITCQFAASALATGTMASSTIPAEKQFRIFCYGDSLTAGTTPDDNTFKLHPYGPHLEQALTKMAAQQSEGYAIRTMPSAAAFAVRWKGFPGMTAKTMSDSLDDSSIGLRSALKKVKNPSVSLAIILAGTNDLATEISTQDGQGATRIAESVIDLHKAAHSEGIDTLGISIPPSGWQSISKEARIMTSEANTKIKVWCEDQIEPKAHFVDHPINVWSRDDTRWGSDGLHFSSDGYQAIGEALGPLVYVILADA